MQMFRKVARAVHASATALILSFPGAAFALTADDLKWDLTYQTVLKNYPLSNDEFLPIWIASMPARSVHEKLVAYKGEPILASVLIETPDMHAGDPLADWIIKTKTSAVRCQFHPKFLERKCIKLDRVKTDRFISALSRFKPMVLKAPSKSVIGKFGDGREQLFNYVGFVSIFANGAASQRPIATAELMNFGMNPENEASPEAGRMALELARLTMTASQFKEFQTANAAQTQDMALRSALEAKNLRRAGQVLDRGAAVSGISSRQSEISPLPTAAKSGSIAAIDVLIKRGAKLDADESAALKAAIEAGNPDIVRHLLSRGALVDPRNAKSSSPSTVFETPLRFAVRMQMLDMAKLLIELGGDVNYRQARTILATAAIGMNLEMVDLLLKNGAQPDQLADGEIDTPLIYLMGYSGTLMDGPTGKDKQDDIRKSEDTIEAITRRLVAGGANVNFINRMCNTAYAQAESRKSERMKALLVSLGADPKLHENCAVNPR